MFGFAFGKPAAKNMRNNRNTIFVLNRCSNGNRPRAFSHGTFYYRPISHFLEFHLVAVGGKIDVLRIKINQTFNGLIQFSGIVSFQWR